MLRFNSLSSNSISLTLGVNPFITSELFTSFKDSIVLNRDLGVLLYRY